MLSDKVWLTVSVPVHHKGVEWGWGQVVPHQTGKRISLWSWLHAQEHCYVKQETDKHKFGGTVT